MRKGENSGLEIGGKLVSSSSGLGGLLKMTPNVYGTYVAPTRYKTEITLVCLAQVAVGAIMVSWAYVAKYRTLLNSI